MALNISVDTLFPDAKMSNANGKIDINTLFGKTDETDISFNVDKLIERIKKRRETKLNCYMKMLKYCHTRIIDADNFQETDIIFTTIDVMPNCKEFIPRECIEYISDKLRNEHFDTLIISDTSLFITWNNIELNKQS
jgi:hypothetical protein